MAIFIYLFTVFWFKGVSEKATATICRSKHQETKAKGKRITYLNVKVKFKVTEHKKST